MVAWPLPGRKNAFSRTLPCNADFSSAPLSWPLLPSHRRSVLPNTRARVLLRIYHMNRVGLAENDHLGKPQGYSICPREGSIERALSRVPRSRLPLCRAPTTPASRPPLAPASGDTSHVPPGVENIDFRTSFAAREQFFGRAGGVTGCEAPGPCGIIAAATACANAPNGQDPVCWTHAHGLPVGSVAVVSPNRVQPARVRSPR